MPYTVSESGSACLFGWPSCQHVCLDPSTHCLPSLSLSPIPPGSTCKQTLNSLLLAIHPLSGVICFGGIGGLLIPCIYARKQTTYNVKLKGSVSWHCLQGYGGFSSSTPDDTHKIMKPQISSFRLLNKLLHFSY